MSDAYTLYSMQLSGNCYKIRLALHELGLPFRIVDVEKGSGVTASPEFLALNPHGRIPVGDQRQ